MSLCNFNLSVAKTTKWGEVCSFSFQVLPRVLNLSHIISTCLVANIQNWRMGLGSRDTGKVQQYLVCSFRTYEKWKNLYSDVIVETIECKIFVDA